MEEKWLEKGGKEEGEEWRNMEGDGWGEKRKKGKLELDKGKWREKWKRKWGWNGKRWNGEVKIWREKKVEGEIVREDLEEI